jgi:hypothetical protein
MGLFDANLRTIRRVFEHMWRDMAKLAGEEGFLTAPRAKLEIRMRLWVYPDKKRSTASNSWEVRTTFDIDTESAKAVERGPKPKSLWERLMAEPED